MAFTYTTSDQIRQHSAGFDGVLVWGGIAAECQTRTGEYRRPRRRAIPASADASLYGSWVPRARGGLAETGCRPY